MIRSFVGFVVEGRGTPLPAAAPKHLVVGGLYRYVRNPMYVALLVAALGQALLFWTWAMVAYAVFMWAVPAVFVRWYEEPKPHREFGAEYETYRAAVRAWIPRLRPWTPPRA